MNATLIEHLKPTSARSSKFGIDTLKILQLQDKEIFPECVTLLANSETTRIYFTLATTIKTYEFNL